MECSTCTAPVNIAVIKYWGKRDVDLVLPLNSSVSVTLSQDQLRAKTTIVAGHDFTEDRLWLNGREECVDTPRIQNLIKAMKTRAREQKTVQGEKVAQEQDDVNTQEILNWKLHMCSENNFPTAAGLASSAAGYACLAFTLADLYKVKGDISSIARQGSGSACRSVYGGFVVWEKGEMHDGKDSVARPIASHDHWPELSVLILVVSDQKKHIGSTEGMQNTARTCELMPERLRIVPQRVKEINTAILDKDFQTFADLTMKDSNQLHAVCLDTYPPISYMTDVSRQIVTLIHAVNKFYKQNKVAYTFDAGPNACLYLLEEDVPLVVSLVAHFFPPLNGEDFYTGLPVTKTALDKECLNAVQLPIQKSAIKYIIHTRPGPGPQVCNEDESLLNEQGLPKYLHTDKRKIDCVS